MPTINESRAILEESFITGWATTTPIAFDNVIFDDSSVDEYVEMRFVMFASNNMTVGSALTKAIRHVGSLVVVINVKLNEGSGKAWEYADQAKTIMENTCHASGIYTTASEVRRNGDTEDGWFSVICSTPFVSEEY